ncbi:MAG: DUF4234 domain-containing protein [Jatrophihabitantaceae bacterium]
MTSYGNQPARPGGPIGKQRGGINVVLLSIITLGIYWLVYVYKTHNEIKQHSGVGLGGPVALIIAIFLGFLTPFLLGNDVKAVRQRAGMADRVSWLTGFWTFIPLLGAFIFVPKLQGALNEYWAAQGGR